MLQSQRDQFRELRAQAAALVDRLERPLRFAREFKDSFGIPLRHSGPIPGQTYTFQEAIMECRRVAQRLKGTRFSQHTLIQSAALDQAVRHIANLNGRVPGLSATIDQVSSDGRPMQIVEGSRLHLRESGETVADFADLLSYIYQQTDALKALMPHLEAGQQQRPLGAKDDDEALALDRAEISRAASETGRKSKLVDKLIAEIENQGAQIAERARANVEEASNARSTITEALAAVTTLRAEMEERKLVIDSAAAAADKALAVAQERAEEIGRTNNSAQSKNAEIDSLVSKVSAAVKTQERLANDMAVNNSEIARALAAVGETVERADKMLSVATVSGLASSFHVEKKSLEDGMRVAAIGFVSGILLLFVTTGILATYVLEIPLHLGFLTIENAGQTEARGDEADLGGVAARAIILLAPFWAALFSARRYNALFDLRQHYSHKYNIAYAVDGFQKQAPEYRELLATMAFQKLLDNPVDHAKSRKIGDTPMTAMGEFLKPVTDQLADIRNFMQTRKE